jgi:ABC-type transport system involved in cytochrome c biogenesis permease subunit
MERTLFTLAFSLYAVSTALALAYMFMKDDRLTQWMWRLLGVGIAAHAVSSGLQIQIFWQNPANRYYFPVNTFFGVFSWIALANAVVFFIVEGVARLNILGAFVLPWTVLAAGAAFFAVPDAGTLQPDLQSLMMNVHPKILMTAYVGFANAFGVGLALLIQERQMKSRKPTALTYRLPAIEELDRLHNRLLMFSYPFLVLGIFLGGLWAKKAWGRFWGWDLKECWAALTLMIYGWALFVHRFRGVRGRRNVYISMAGFLTILITTFIVNYFSKQHTYIYTPTP